jgi:two-component system, LuxR family, sensor kinase FixL
MHTDDVTKYIENVGIGNHITCIYRDVDELISVLASFFRLGFKAHNKCIYVFDGHTGDQIISELRKVGLDLSEHIGKEDFLFLKKEDVYFKNGTFNSIETVSLIKDVEEAALKAGYKGIWVSGNASWLKEYKAAKSDFIQHEAKMNSLLQDRKINVLCLYNEKMLDPKTLIDVLRTHPHVYLYDHFVNNKYFAVSDNFSPLGNISSPTEKYKKLISAL